MNNKGHALLSVFLFLIGAVLILIFFQLPAYSTILEKMFIMVVAFIFIISGTMELGKDDF